MIKYDDLMKELMLGQWKPIYLLYGQEPYYIDKVCAFIDKYGIDENSRVFNYNKFNGRDLSAVEVAHVAQGYPMGGEKRLVIVRDAQALHKGERESNKDIAELVKYAAHAMPQTILVLCYNSKDYKDVPPQALVKAVDKCSGAVMESKPIFDNQINSFIQEICKEQSVKIDSKASELLAESVGTNLLGLEQAIIKIKMAVGQTLQIINVDHIQKFVGVSIEYSNIALRAAIFKREVTKVNRIVHEFSKNEKAHPVQAIVPFLYSGFQKVFIYHYLSIDQGLSPDAIAVQVGEKPGFAFQMNFMPAVGNFNVTQCYRILSVLQQYDVRSKGFKYPATDYSDYLGELIFKIMNV